MTDIEQKAHAEAEEGWPFGHEDMRVRDIRSGARAGFVAGAVWQASQRQAPADVDALIEEARGVSLFYDDVPALILRLADALERASQAVTEEWEIGYQLIDPDGNSVGTGFPFPTTEEAAEFGARQAREQSERNPMWPTVSRVVRRRKAGPWEPAEAAREAGR